LLMLHNCTSMWQINLLFILYLFDNTFTRMILGFHQGVNEVFALLGCYALFIGSQWLAFWDIIFSILWPLKVGPI
jgi:hypothetical protein